MSLTDFLGIGPISTGEISTAEKVSAQDPAGPPLVIGDNGRIQTARPTTEPTSAVIDFGTDAQATDFGLFNNTVPLSESQATDSTQGLGRQVPDDYYDYGYGLNDPNNVNSNPSVYPGVGAENDDVATKNNVQSRVDQLFSEERFTPRSNVLDIYASYTWNAAVYMLKNSDAENLFTNKRKIPPSDQLLFQSAGVGNRNQNNQANAATGAQGINQTQANNPFTLDYYMDEIQLKSKIIGRGTGLSSADFDLRFTVVEPYGFSLLENLYKFSRSLGLPNYGAITYLLVIKFYGYDAAGNLVEAGTVDPDGDTSRGLVVEKYYPFILEKITTKLMPSAMRYEWTGKVVPYIIAGGNRGQIPYNIALSGATVEQLLGNNDTEQLNNNDVGSNEMESQNEIYTPAAANTGGNQSATQVISGLASALNRFQSALVKQGRYTIPDEYLIRFSDNELAGSKLTTVSRIIEKAYTPLSVGSNVDANQPDKQAVLVNQRLKSAIAGTPIVLFIDKVVRNSDWILSQADFVYDENYQTLVPKKGTNTTKSIAWFKIGMQAIPKGFDPKRNDNAYKIIYTVSPYAVNNLKSVYFPNTELQGIHKKYSIFFTGQNTQVLDFSQDFNYLYYEVISGSLASNRTETSSSREIAKKFSQPFSAQSAQGADGRTNEIAANAADYLYSPRDLADVKLTIIGDPAWMQQGEAFAGFDPVDLNFSAFLRDGTINYDAREIIFEVNYNLPVDYNNQTGLQDPGQNNFDANRAGGVAGQPRQSFLYTAYEVTSIFKEGKFIQELRGKLFRTSLPKTTSNQFPEAKGSPDYVPPSEPTEADLGELGINTDVASRDLSIGDTDGIGLEGGTSPYAQPYIFDGLGSIEPDVRDEPGIYQQTAYAARVNNTSSQDPEYYPGNAEPPELPVSDGRLVGLPDNSAASIASGTLGFANYGDNIVQASELQQPPKLPPGKVNSSPDLLFYQQNFDAATATAASKKQIWEQSVLASNVNNFPGALTGNVTARNNWVAAKQQSSTARIDYLDAENDAKQAYSQIINSETIITISETQVIARDNRGG